VSVSTGNDATCADHLGQPGTFHEGGNGSLQISGLQLGVHSGGGLDLGLFFPDQCIAVGNRGLDRVLRVGAGFWAGVMGVSFG
jgi:hypothetical protein